MLGEIIVRDAVEADLPAIVAIYNAAIPSRVSNASREPVTVDQRRGWFHEHSPHRRPLWVAEETVPGSAAEPRVVAWIGLADFLPRYAYHITAELSLYVAPDRRRTGLGRMLMERMIAAASGLGVENLASLVFAQNEASIALHQQLGFTRWGLLPQVTEIDGVRRDVVLLGRNVL